MNPSHAIPALSLGLLMLGLAGCGPAKKDQPPPTPKVGAATMAPAAGVSQAMALPKIGPGPAWKLKDLNGADVTSDQFKGKVVVIDFWATWCPPCREEIPGYVELTQKYGKDGLVIIGISLDQAGPDVVKAFAAKYKINYPLVMGDDAVVAAFGGVEGIPTTFLIDREGQVRDRKVGMEAKEDYERKILAVLKG